MNSSNKWKTNGSADWAPSMEPLVLMKGTKLEEGPGAVTKGILMRAGVDTVPRVWEGALECRLRLQLLPLWQSE